MTPSDPTAALKNSGDMILGELKQQKRLLIVFGIVLIGLVALTAYTVYVVKSLTTTTPGSPIVVRGGAMTVFTNAGIWVPQSQNKKDTSFCVNLSKNPSSISITYENQLDPSGNPVTQTSSNLSVPWTLNILGHDPDDLSDPKNPNQHDGKKASTNGISFVSQSHACDNSASHPYSIVMSSIRQNENAPVGFYMLKLPMGSAWTDSLRFWDGSGNSNPNSPKGVDDEEFRERMQSIAITPANGGTSSTYQCPDGECVVSIETP
jgi:hypothetical protein